MQVSERIAHGVAKTKPEGVHLLKQVHGTKIVVVRDGSELAAALSAKTSPDGGQDRGLPPADGWLTDAKRLTFGVYTADCIPLFMSGGGFVGVFHAGWRGVAAGLPRAAVEAFAAVGIPTAAIKAWSGPFIQRCCFKVGPEVAQQFTHVRESYVDLAAETREQLRGVKDIALEGDCTCCNPSWFSYRRDKTAANRIYGWIRLEA